nr:MAG TPA: hypothetical protein [Caudoviricetes sp.]
MKNFNRAYKSMAYMEMAERTARRNNNYKWIEHSEQQLVAYSYLQKELNKINKKYGQEEMPKTVLFETREERMDYNGRTVRGKAAYARSKVELAELRYRRNVLANFEKISREDKELALKYKEECEDKANQIFDAYRVVSKIKEDNKILVPTAICLGFLGGIMSLLSIYIGIILLIVPVAAVVRIIMNRGFGGRFNEKLLEKYIEKQNKKDHKE